MQLTTVKELFAQSEKYLNTEVEVGGWIRSIRDSKAFGFIVLNDGKVDAFGTHEELVENNAIYRDVYEAQVHGSGDFDEGGDN